MPDVLIQELSTVGCAYCTQAKKILETEIKSQFPDVRIEYIDMLSPKGQELTQKHGILSSPGILVNGELFSMGGLDKDKLVAKIRALRA